MILEKIPAVAQLSPGEQWQLIDELWERLLPPDDAASRAAIVELIETRTEHYRAHPESASTWAAIRERLERLRSCRN